MEFALKLPIYLTFNAFAHKRHHPFRMSWRGTSDWDEFRCQALVNACLCPVPTDSKSGILLRSIALYRKRFQPFGRYNIDDDGAFTLNSLPMEGSKRQERIWLQPKDVRFKGLHDAPRKVRQGLSSSFFFLLKFASNRWKLRRNPLNGCKGLSGYPSFSNGLQ